jgi:hypothetical protein
MAKLTVKQKIELEKQYQQYITDQAGILHNKIVAFLSESKVPLIQVLLVLEMLLDEVKTQLRKQHFGG